MTRHAPTTHKTRAPPKPAHVAHVPAAHPKPVPVAFDEPEVERLPDQPFAEGALDAMDPDFRHRLISEAAYRRYVERNYEDGYDLDDWLAAEADVDHLLVDRVTRA